MKREHLSIAFSRGKWYQFGRTGGRAAAGVFSPTLVVEVVQVEANRLQVSSLLAVLGPVTGVGSSEGMMGRGRGRRPGRLLPLLGTEEAEVETQPLTVPPQLLLEAQRSLRSQTLRKSRSKRWWYRDIENERHFAHGELENTYGGESKHLILSLKKKLVRLQTHNKTLRSNSWSHSRNNHEDMQSAHVGLCEWRAVSSDIQNQHCVFSICV